MLPCPGICEPAGGAEAASAVNPGKARSLAAGHGYRRSVRGWRFRPRRLSTLALATCLATAAGATEVRQVTIGSTPGPDTTYSAGDRISVTVQFDAAVEVAGTPVLEIEVGGTPRRARMWTHGGSRLHFGYTVRAADNDPDGISIEAGAIKLAGGRIDGPDGDAATLSLRGHTVANAPEHRVDGAGAWPPGIESVSVTSNPGVDGAYRAGDLIEVTVEFDEQVFVEGKPEVAVRIGGKTRAAQYRGGSGSHRLRFTTRVWEGDIADTGIALPEGGLSGAAGITDADGNRAEAAYAGPGRQPRHRVDAIGPRVVGLAVVSTPPPGGVYGEADLVSIEVAFDEDVYLTGVATMPVWPLARAEPRYATAVRSSGRSILFHHNVVPEDNSARLQIGRGELSGTRSLQSLWTTIRDRAGNRASPEYSGSGRFHDVPLEGSKADTKPPAVDSVFVVSEPRDGETYGRGEVIAVRVVLTEPVQTAPDGNSAELEVVLGAKAKTLRSQIRSGDRFVTFTHAVTESDVAADGLTLAGTARVGPVKDAAGNRFDGESLAFDPFTAANHKVDGRRGDPARPALLWAGSGRLMFDGRVEVHGTAEVIVGESRRPMHFEQPSYSFIDRDLSSWQIAYRSPGAPRGEFVFDGASVPPEGWPGLSFRDSRGRPVHVDPWAVPLPRRPLLGWGFVGVALIPPPHGGWSFGEGQVLEFHVVFGQPVNVTGAARLKVGVRELSCLPRNGRVRYFWCRRTIAAGESAPRVELARGALRLVASSIKDDDGNAVDGDLSRYADRVEPFSIDTTPPRVGGVSIASTPAVGGTYGAGAVVSVVVRFTEPVRATGSEQLAITIGGNTRLASLDGTSGNDGLRFSHVVLGADADADGLALPADALRLNGGAITDAAGNPAELSHNAVGDRDGHRVDGSTADISTTPVRVRFATLPGPGVGSPRQAAKSSLTWQPASTWSRQPRMEYAVTADRADVLVGRASGRVRLGQSVTNNLRMPCGTAGTASVRLTVSVKDAETPASWDVLCRAGVIRVREVEVFQGPLAGRLVAAGAGGRVRAIAHRRGMGRVHVEHDSVAAPGLAVGIHGADGVAELDASYAGTRRTADKWVSSYTVPLAAATLAPGYGLDVVANPDAHLDADAVPTPRLGFDALGARTLPAFKPVFVPIRILDEVPEVNADALLRETRSLLPVARVAARVRAPFVYEPSAQERSQKWLQSRRLFESLVELANSEGAADEFTIGVALPPAGWQPELTDHRHGGSVQLVLGETGASELVAVGVGAGMGLEELPCRTLGDPRFPHDGIGGEGSYSFLEGRFVTASEEYYDLMSDCVPRHISDHSYRQAMAWGDRANAALRRNTPTVKFGDVDRAGAIEIGVRRDAGADSGRETRSSAMPRSLALSGSVDEHGFWSLFAAATSTLPPRVDVPGDFLLTLHDDSGIEMYRQRLATADVGKSVGQLSGTWAVRVPMQHREVHAARIRDTSGGPAPRRGRASPRQTTGIATLTDGWGLVCRREASRLHSAEDASGNPAERATGAPGTDASPRQAPLFEGEGIGTEVPPTRRTRDPRFLRMESVARPGSSRCGGSGAGPCGRGSGG